MSGSYFLWVGLAGGGEAAGVEFGEADLNKVFVVFGERGHVEHCVVVSHGVGTQVPGVLVQVCLREHRDVTPLVRFVQRFTWD